MIKYRIVKMLINGCYRIDKKFMLFSFIPLFCIKDISDHWFAESYNAINWLNFKIRNKELPYGDYEILN